ncbi:MAG TPA: phosphatase PAP2 family protein [Egibacteraceae bacterium]|nr:phosphatase PAP2 family protein [Egibacteraceae bacterium]
MTPRWPLHLGAGLGVLGATWYALRYPAVQRGDVRAGDAVRRFGTRSLDAAVTHTTDLGSVYSVIGVASVMAATGRHRTAADVLGVGLTAWNVAQLSKTRVRRQRPFEADGVRRLIRKPTGSSFPSGHAAVGVAMFTMLADRAITLPARRVLQAIGAYVALSRIYVGVHYPTDVIGGAGMGVAIGAVWRGPLASVNARIVNWLYRQARRGWRR